nr:FCD domain-containing protein [Streptomyces sp. SN-593]
MAATAAGLRGARPAGEVPGPAAAGGSAPPAAGGLQAPTPSGRSAPSSASDVPGPAAADVPAPSAAGLPGPAAAGLPGPAGGLPAPAPGGAAGRSAAEGGAAPTAVVRSRAGEDAGVLGPRDVSGLRAERAHGGTASAAARAAFVDADIALHTAVVAAAYNPVLTDLFAEFTPVLRENVLALLDLMDVRTHDEEHGEAAHAALVEAIAEGDADLAARVLRDELATTQAHLADRHAPVGDEPS